MFVITAPDWDKLATEANVGSLHSKLGPVHHREYVYGLFRRARNVLETLTCCKLVSTAFSTSPNKPFRSVSFSDFPRALSSRKL